MKTPNTTDQIFKEKLGGYASEVPAGLWDAIDNQRSRKKRGALLLQRHGKWLALVLLLVVGGLWYAIDSETVDGGRLMVDETTAIIVENKEKNADKFEKSSIENIENKQNIPLTTETTATEQSPVLNTKNLIEKSSKNSVSKPISTSISKSTPFVKSATNIDQNASNDAAFDNIDNSIIGTNDGLENAFTKTENPTETDESTPANLLIANAKEQNENNALNALEMLKLSELFHGKPDPCYAFNPYDSGKKGPPHFYIDVLGGPMYANRTLAAKNDDLASYATIRDSTETSRLGFNSTIRASLVLANGIALRSGVAYTQINEKLDLFDGTTTDIAIYEIKDVHGNIIGTQTDTIIGQRIKTTYNRYKMVDIPVILGYEVRDRNWTIALNGGAYFNVLFEQKGEFLSPDLTTVNFTSTEEEHYDAFNNSVGMSLFGSVGLHYKIGNRLHLMAEPQFRYFMDSFTNADYPLQQNYWAVGMNLGVRVQVF